MNASSRLGVSWFSIFENEQEQLYLRANHFFLGAGARDAFFEITGCTEEPLWFEVPYDDKGNRFFSEIPLETCDFNEPITLGLYFKENGRKRLVDIYEERPVQLSVPKEQNLHFNCDDASIYFGIRIPPDMQRKKIELAYRFDNERVVVSQQRILFGYYSRFILAGDFDCTQISGGYLNDTFFPIYEIPGA